MNQKERNVYRELPDGYYHLCLDRLEGRWLFHTPEDYRLGMASIALAYLKFGILVYAFELMPNHLHLIIRGNQVSAMHKADVRRMAGSNEKLPDNWEIHPVLGILPRNYIQADKVEKLFSSAKEYLTRLVKEYETMVKIARSLEEVVEFSEAEIRDLVNTELRNSHPGRPFKSISQDEKCKVAVRLNEMLGLTAYQLSQALFMSELTISQALRSKDYGVRFGS